VSEAPVQEALGRHLRPGGVFYDVGANVGFFSLIAARLVGPTGRVHAFEPVAENAAAVRENARLSGLANVVLHEVAVGRGAGSGQMLLTAWDGGGALSTSVVRPPAPSATRTVRVVALDDFAAAERLPRPALVKCRIQARTPVRG
jgi:FkbM family methyltransferase